MPSICSKLAEARLMTQSRDSASKKPKDWMRSSRVIGSRSQRVNSGPGGSFGVAVFERVTAAVIRASRKE